MDTQFLQSFVMVVDCGSMAEAARRLDLTPAAVAARVKSLEEAMGTTLVRRAGRWLVSYWNSAPFGVPPAAALRDPA